MSAFIPLTTRSGGNIHVAVDSIRAVEGAYSGRTCSVHFSGLPPEHSAWIDMTVDDVMTLIEAAEDVEGDEVAEE